MLTQLRSSEDTAMDMHHAPGARRKPYTTPLVFDLPPVIAGPLFIWHGEAKHPAAYMYKLQIQVSYFNQPVHWDNTLRAAQACSEHSTKLKGPDIAVGGIRTEAARIKKFCMCATDTPYLALHP